MEPWLYYLVTVIVYAAVVVTAYFIEDVSLVSISQTGVSTYGRRNLSDRVLHLTSVVLHKAVKRLQQEDSPDSVLDPCVTGGSPGAVLFHLSRGDEGIKRGVTYYEKEVVQKGRKGYGEYYL